MTDPARTPLLRRAQILLGLDRETAQRFVDGRYQTTPAEASALVRRSVRPTPETLGKLRVDPNLVTRRGLDALDPPVSTELIESARPFFTMREVVEATQLDAEVVSDLFELAPYRYVDAPGGRAIALEPVAEMYLLEARELEVAGLNDAGFTALESAPGIPSLSIVVPRFELESAGPAASASALKRKNPGAVHPVFHDDTGARRYFVPGLVVVQFARSSAPSHRASVLAEAGLVLERQLSNRGLLLARLRRSPEDRDTARAAMRALSRLSEFETVQFAEPEQFGESDFELPVAVEPSELEDATRWWNHAQIRLDAAHVRSRGSRDVTVFVIDSGIDTDHPDLADALRDGWTQLDLSYDLHEDDRITSPEASSIGHGTQVSSVVVGQSTDGQGVRGIAPDCALLPFKIPASSGGLGAPGWSLRAAAIHDALDSLAPGQRGVLNISWRTTALSIAIREALADAADADVAVVMSAGNYGPGQQQAPDELHYPSVHADRDLANKGTPLRYRRLAQSSVSVGAVDAQRRKASYSYFGSARVGLFAPGGEVGGDGVGLYTATLSGRRVYSAGTSFATPHVAGVLALIRSIDPALSARGAVAVLFETAVSLDGDNPEYRGLLGQGMLDAAAAIAAVSWDVPLLPAEVVDVAPVRLNDATVDQLMELPFVGEYRAKAIVRHRDRYGPFRAVFELLWTGVFDPWTTAQLAELVAV